jgi:inosose dehydratase
MERRHFLQLGALGAATLLDRPAALAEDQPQKFRIGMAATTWLSAKPSTATYWQAVEGISSLGVGATEADNSKAQLDAVYGADPRVFLSRSQKYGVHLTGVYQALFLHEAQQLPDMRSQIRSLSKFLKAAGADYIALGWDTRPAEGGKPYQRSKVDLQQAIRSADDLGKISLEEFDLPIAFHAERDVPGKMILEMLDGTNPKFVRFCADVGHLTAAGLDAVQTVKKYSSRLFVSHWKDFDPNLAAPEYLGQGAKGDFVEAGKGIVDFAALAKLYRDLGFDGWVLLELDQSREPSILESARKMTRYVTDQLKLHLFPRAS